MMSRQKNCTLKFYPNLTKKSRKDSRYPIYLKLTYDGRKAESRLPTEFDLSAQELSLWNQEFMAVGGNKGHAVNGYLTRIKANWEKYNLNNDFVPKHSLANIIEIILGRRSLDLNAQSS